MGFALDLTICRQPGYQKENYQKEKKKNPEDEFQSSLIKASEYNSSKISCSLGPLRNSTPPIGLHYAAKGLTIPDVAGSRFRFERAREHSHFLGTAGK